MPNYNCVHPGCESEFLTIYLSGVLLCECLIPASGGALNDEVWLLFECEPYIDLVSIWHHSHDKCLQAFLNFLLFIFHVLYWMQTEEQNTGEAWERGYDIVALRSKVMITNGSLIPKPIRAVHKGI